MLYDGWRAVGGEHSKNVVWGSSIVLILDPLFWKCPQRIGDAKYPLTGIVFSGKLQFPAQSYKGLSQGVIDISLVLG